MSSKNRLASLYEEWRLMSEVEGEAIRTQDWQDVHRCQTTKAALQAEIVSVTGELIGSVVSSDEIRRQFRPVIEHLISLEIRNNELLGTTRARLETERDRLDANQRNLGRLRSTYGASASTV